jgi:hypothetical protein
MSNAVRKVAGSCVEEESSFITNVWSTSSYWSNGIGCGPEAVLLLPRIWTCEIQASGAENGAWSADPRLGALGPGYSPTFLCGGVTYGSDTSVKPYLVRSK